MGDPEVARREQALQWSRGLLAAETMARAYESNSLAWLQWSRGLLAAETRRNGNQFNEATGMLQWSRGLLAAETDG